MSTELSAVSSDEKNEMEAYERLLTDAMKGDSLLFVRQDAVEAAWAIVDPILGNAVPALPYQPGSGDRPKQHNSPHASETGTIPMASPSNSK